MTDRAVRCSDASRAAGERLAGTAPHVDRWLLLEAPGGWARDVGVGAGLPDAARAHVARWLADRAERRRVLFVRRPGRARSKRLAWVVRAQESDVEIRRIELRRADDLAGMDLERAGTPVESQLVLVCGHGSRDACCARRGTAVYERLASMLGEEQLWVSSHHGGHRFAANVLVLPAALHFGRVEPDEARELVHRALAGEIVLERYRGRTCYRPAVQAVEHALRTVGELRRVADVTLAGVDDSLVSFRTAAGSLHAAEVSEHDGPSVPASCGEPPEIQPEWVVRPV